MNKAFLWSSDLDNSGVDVPSEQLCGACKSFCQIKSYVVKHSVAEMTSLSRSSKPCLSFELLMPWTLLEFGQFDFESIPILNRVMYPFKTFLTKTQIGVFSWPGWKRILAVIPEVFEITTFESVVPLLAIPRLPLLESSFLIPSSNVARFRIFSIISSVDWL